MCDVLSRFAGIPAPLCVLHAARINYKERPSDRRAPETMVGLFYKHYEWLNGTSVMMMIFGMEVENDSLSSVQSLTYHNLHNLIY